MVVAKRIRRTFEAPVKKVRMCLMFMMISTCLSSLMQKLQASCAHVCGSCKYMATEGSGVMDNFLLESVVPHVLTRYFVMS